MNSSPSVALEKSQNITLSFEDRFTDCGNPSSISPILLQPPIYTPSKSKPSSRVKSIHTPSKSKRNVTAVTPSSKLSPKATSQLISGPPLIATASELPSELPTTPNTRSGASKPSSSKGKNKLSDSDSDDEEILGSESLSDDSDIEKLSNPFDDILEDEDDDLEFDQNVDYNVYDENVHGDPNVQFEEDVFNIRVKRDDFGSCSSGSDGVPRVRYPQLNPLVDFNSKIHLLTGMKFGTNDVFKRALRQFAIENDFDYYYLHNDNKRVSAYCINKCHCPLKHDRKKCKPGCKEDRCSFKAKARRMRNDGTFQMKSFVPKHYCG